MFLALVGAGLLSGIWFMARLRTPRSVATGARPVSVSVSVIVPARNEAASLPHLLESLTALVPPAGEILVVDDSSTDETVAIASKYGATVLDAGALPAGWCGKPWACHVGAEAATGTYLLFLDADTRVASDALTHLLGAHAQEGGLVSVQPYHVTEHAYEELSAHCNTVAMMGSGAFTPGAASRRDASVAFGACLVTTASDYRRVGGHAAVHDEIVEDVALAQRYRAAGLPVTCFAGGDRVQFRMYPSGLRELVDGWSKNLAAGAARTDRIAALATVFWVSAQVAVMTQAATTLVQWMRGETVELWMPLAAWAVVTLHLLLVFRRVGSFHWWIAVAFPVPLLTFVGIFFRSLVLTFVRHEVRWRGRRVPIPSRPSASRRIRSRSGEG